MKITSLDIDGFGVWSRLRLERLSDGLNVVYGPNEAGKSTLLQFIRSVLYGFSTDRKRYLPPMHGGKAGGSIAVAVPRGNYRIDRHHDVSLPSREIVNVVAADGSRPGDQTVKSILSNLDEPTFNNVFAVGLREIQELATLGDTQAADLLYSITAGLDRVSLVEVMRELDALRNRILDSKGGPCQVTQMLDEREQLRREIGGHDSLNNRYARLAGERAEIDREVTGLEDEHGKALQNAQVLDLAHELSHPWSQRAALHAELAALGPQPVLPSDAVERLDSLNDRLAKSHHRLKRLLHKKKTLSEEAEGLDANEALGRQSARIEAMLEQEPWIGTVQKQVAALETEATELRTSLLAEHEQLGLGKATNPDKLPTFSGKAIARLRGPARAIRTSHEEMKRAEEHAAATTGAATKVGHQVNKALSARNVEDLSSAIDHAGGLVNLLRRRIQVDEKLEQMGRDLKELQDENQHLLENQNLPIPVIIMLGIGIILGPAFGAIFYLAPNALHNPIGQVITLLAVVVTVVCIYGKLSLQKSSATQLDECVKQLQVLQQQVRQAKAERTVLDEELPSGGGPLVARLSSAEKELASLEELAPLHGRHTAAHQDAESATQRLAKAQQAVDHAHRRWKDGLNAAGLPHDLEPSHIKHISRRSRHIRQMQHRLAQVTEELGQRRRELDSIVHRVTQLGADCEIKLTAKHPAEQLHQLSDALTHQKARLERRDAITHSLRRIRHHHTRGKGAIARLERRHKALLTNAGVENEIEFRRRARDSGRVEALRRDMEAIDRDITLAIGSRCSHETLRQHLEGDASTTLDARRDAAHQRHASLAHQLRDMIEKRGQISEQMRALADDRSLAGKQLDLALLEKRLEDAIRRWQVLALTSHFLKKIRMAYENERQPETLQEASGFLERLTQGRYRRVWTPLGEQVLRVDDAQGHALPIESLSRGTREQLFLSLRLALAAYYSRHGATLPLVLDDILVNFDAERAKAAATMLRDFAAEGHQILVFTCHDHIAKIFKAIKVPVATLPDNSLESHEPIVFEEPPIKEKPKRAAKPAPLPKQPEPIAEEPVVEEPVIEDEEEEFYVELPVIEPVGSPHWGDASAANGRLSLEAGEIWEEENIPGLVRSR